MKKKIIINILMIISLIISYLVLDLGIRWISNDYINFYSYKEITPILFTVSYILFFILLIYLLPKKIGTILYIVNILFLNVIVLSEFLHFRILGRFFDIYDMLLTSDGAMYFSYALKQMNFKIVIVILISILFSIMTVILIRKNTFRFNFKNDKLYIVLIIALIFISRYAAIKRLGKLSDEFDYNNNPKNVYESYSNLNRSLEVSGLYEYMFKCTGIFISDMFSDKNELKEEVDSYISNTTNNIQTNEYTGIFKDKNLILILLESIDSFMVNEKNMPTLTYLMNTGINFTNRYAPTFGGGRTINSEFSANTGLYSVSRGMSVFTYKDNTYPYSLPNMFKNIDYNVNSVHANTGSFYSRNKFHKELGFNKHYSVMDMYQNIDYLFDSNLSKNDDLYKLIVPGERFMTYVPTISAHLPYDSTNVICESNDEIACLGELANETDTFLKVLIERLGNDDILEDTVIVLFSDHYNYGYSDIDYIYKYKNTDKYNLLDNIPFVIWNNNIEHREIDTIMDTADITPTLLNMFGIDYNTKYYMGDDVFSSNHENFIYFNDYSWYDGNIYYDNNYHGEITDYIKNNTKIVNEKIKINDYIIKSNYFKK